MPLTTGLEGKVVLITGGSGGIGRAVASAMAAQGARLAICGRDEPRLQQIVDELRSGLRTDIISVKANMTRLNDIRRFVGAAMSKFGRIDILVNNAGGMHVGGILQTSEEDLEYHIQLKLLGYIRTSREVIEHMKACGGGKIINIVGMAGREPGPLFLLPGVINAALLNFTKSLSKGLEGDHITVNSVNPGPSDTPLAEETIKSIGALSQKSPGEVPPQAPPPKVPVRLASPGDVANAVLFLASEAASFINGTSINVDAGESLGIW
ncbi:MAG TPA: SDR family NAD(P)-dependent oxidoreductase [Bacteroidota bacterium]|jgi:3-oxoacyl-[acyl-carrier protein] reductase/bacilysin biosynthesis oxidoreductase BacG